MQAIAFDNSYARLPDGFFVRQDPVAVERPTLVKLNARVAKLLNLDETFLTSDDGVNLLAGNLVPEKAEPLAMAYAGHQFGGWAPQLGDGRAILLGELIGNDGIRYDIQLKGAGRTPFSRAGDGRAWIGPVLREYLLSEAMHSLNIASTWSLAAVSTGEAVLRESYMPGALLVRVAKSHIRIGTFEFFAARGMHKELEVLTHYVIERFYPAAKNADNPALALLQAVSKSTAELVAKWQCVGFIHGVMNTDNINVSGETIDYGPCAFMDDYQADKVFSSIDMHGRYAYRNQPGIAQWNLAVLAQSLMPLISSDESDALQLAQTCINTFPDTYKSFYLKGLRHKLGLYDSHDNDLALGSDLFDIMERGKADFTLTFRYLSRLAGLGLSASDLVNNTATKSDDPKTVDHTASTNKPSNALDEFLDLFKSSDSAGEEARHWIAQWLDRLSLESISPDERSQRMCACNPLVIPRNHNVEEAIAAAVQSDFSVFENLLSAITDPFSDAQLERNCHIPPTSAQTVLQTFCGT